MTRSRTIYLHPPTPPVSRKAKANQSQAREAYKILFKNRAALFPVWITFALYVAVTIVGPYPWAPMVIGLAGTALAVAWYQARYEPPRYVPWLKLERPVEHWYAAACAMVGTLWAEWSIWNPAGTPGLRATGVAVCLMIVMSVPWWHHRRIRGSIPLRMDGLSGTERNLRIREAQKLISEWTAFTSAGHVQGAKLRAITISEWCISLSVQLRRGATVTEFTPLRLAKLESAAEFDGMHTGGARVERLERHTRQAILRFMIKDPHENPIKAPLTGNSSVENILLGLFETGESVLFSLINTLVGGTTGAGKSGIINMIVWALARIPTVAIVGIDMKPGAPELGPWRKVLHALATTPDEVTDVLDRILAGLEYRGAIMKANGWRKWVPTREHPHIVLIVDEVQKLKDVRNAAKKLNRITEIIRAYGGSVVVATQYPTAPNVSVTLKGNCPQKIGLYVEETGADRVIFGESATKNGWRPSGIPSDRNGSFYIRSPWYKRPLLARAFWLTDEDVQEAAESLAPLRTAIDAGTWTHLVAVPAVAAVEAGSEAEPDDMIVDAEIVIPDDDPAERILIALETKELVKDLLTETGIPRPTLYRHLKSLEADGLVYSPSRGVWKRGSDMSQEDAA